MHADFVWERPEPVRIEWDHQAQVRLITAAFEMRVPAGSRVLVREANAAERRCVSSENLSLCALTVVAPGDSQPQPEPEAPQRREPATAVGQRAPLTQPPATGADETILFLPHRPGRHLAAEAEPSPDLTAALADNPLQGADETLLVPESRRVTPQRPAANAQAAGPAISTRLRQPGPGDEAGDPGVTVLTAPAPDQERGVLILDATGERVVPLTGIMVVGRRPSAAQVKDPRAAEITVVPRGNDVSHTHLSLRRLGPTVLARDLWSTNGTRVRTAGMPPFRLRDGEEIALSPGSRLELGDGVVVELLGPGGA